MIAFAKRNLWLLIATVAVAAIFMGAPLLVPHPQHAPPSLGDWGDYIGGAMAVIMFLWLIAGHLENQRELADANHAMQLQLELAREVAGALATIAAGNKVQASEVLADAAPHFVCLSSIGDNVSRNGFVVGQYSFRNEGSRVTLTGVRIIHPNLEGRIEGPRLCGTGGVFKIHLQSTGPLRTVSDIQMRIEYQDMFQISGWARVDAKSFGEHPVISHHRGRSDLP